MPRILLEDCLGKFVIYKTKIVTESVGDFTFTRIPGRLSVCGIKNGNGRRYGRNVWEKNLAENSPLQQLIAENAAFGLLEHPKDGEVTLNSPLAVVLVEAKLDGDFVNGAFRILNTPEGDKLKALIEVGYNPTVSSRGYGSLQKAPDGIDDVQEDYICEAWDVVLKPSFKEARLAVPAINTQKTAPTVADVIPGIKESTFTGVINTPKGDVHSANFKTEAEARAWVIDISESFSAQKIKGFVRMPDGKLLESISSPTPESKPNHQQETPPMDIKSIQTSIETMRQIVPSKLTPQRFAEGMSRCAELHQLAAQYLSEDVKRSWEVQQLHDSITAIEKSWQSAFEVPAKEVVRLRENTTKLTKVLKAVAEAAVGYREKSAQLATTLKTTKEALKETIKRGKLWVNRARIAEKIENNESYQVVNEALEKMVRAYRALQEEHAEEVTELGRTVLQLEFADKLKADAKLTKALAEAKTVDEVIDVREALTGTKIARASLEEKKGLPAFLRKGAIGKDRKKNLKDEDETDTPKATLAKKVRGEESVKPAPKANPVDESTRPPATPVKGISIIEHTRNPNDFEEAIGIAHRLSNANKQQLVG